MKFIGILIFLITCCSPLWAQNYMDVMDNNKVTIHTDHQHKIIFQTKEIHKKTSPDNTYFWYASRKIHETQGDYSGKLLHGDYLHYYPDNELAYKGQFKKGLKTGTWTEWTDDGILKKQSHWKKGQETGAYSLYDEKGNTLEMGKLKAGRRNGKVVMRLPQDSTFSTTYYQEGNEISKEAYIDQNIFRRTGHYIGQQWQKLFSKKNK
ncbi:hypothetical protein FAZ15_21355 [Sphingobacterium olei]|uniref:Toxin-antitoxin system YwqK family antitoxin n=1 Tax=Sphingobacterium olei TaxID=2571155 RepID=A0A4U0N9I7_9SPHI|nr:hypothetical protein [Sphingobacterium olei]TJZ50571.1 hypothetical protein FAZ15_21355 [Sphingobacterium olei]